MMRRRKLKKTDAQRGLKSKLWANYKLFNFNPRNCIFSVIYLLSLLFLPGEMVFSLDYSSFIRKMQRQGCGLSHAFQNFFSTYTPVRINHTISMFISWQTVNPHLCTLYKIIHQADDGEFTAREMRRCCLTTWLGSTGWGDLSVGAGAHVWSGAETVSTWTPADRCKEEHDTRSNNIKMSSVRCKIK